MEQLIPDLRALLLVGIASGVPWAVGRGCGHRWGWPLDFGLRLGDGERLLGAHKTWRGLTAGILACSFAGLLLGSGYLLGSAFGLLALAGDATSSAIKRRLGWPPGAEAPGLDQVPEAMLPLLVLREPLGLSYGSVIAVTLVFTVLDIAIAPLRHTRPNGHSYEQEH